MAQVGATKTKHSAGNAKAHGMQTPTSQSAAESQGHGPRIQNGDLL
eukprot:CAMPEP_0179187140 /NCGR_PEP_ID=MMETSP0796-20121207/92851_1 /TAXON_ID=73915 /ORGANISM="Pyrodinium bahamense, Strain pbaha01" /LENGTH=45 /DNA_ID= /DNA_START= /DNA_END= /DNA_ORIENTATION=